MAILYGFWIGYSLIRGKIWREIIDRKSPIKNHKSEDPMPLHVSRIRAICFDVDGTLSDTDDVFVDRLSRLLEPFRFLFRGRDAARAARRLVMASEAPGNFIIGLPDLLGLDDELAALADWIARRTRSRGGHFRLIAGVKPMLAELSKRYPLAVVSARDGRTTTAFLDQFGLTDYFRCVATAQTCRHTKPFPDPILWAAGQMGVAPDACLMVGDTIVDIRAGRAAGAQTVGVLCGFGEEPELRRRGADMILGETAELAQVLEVPAEKSTLPGARVRRKNAAPSA
jgi:phosphoglycolate phosphatase-like HAD superfamily hydrolase